MLTKDEDLKLKLQTLKSLNNTAGENKVLEWDMISRNISSEDRGEFKDSFCPTYDLDDVTRERLLVHARQDAAMTFLAASDTYKQANMANKYAQWAAIFSFVAMCTSLYIGYLSIFK